jgi:hypothetical protein
MEIDPDRSVPLVVISVTGADCPIAALEVQMLINAIADNEYRAMINDRSGGKPSRNLKILAELNTSNSNAAPPSVRQVWSTYDSGHAEDN